MKVIDLLNKIANGEEVPNKIKYNGTIYKIDNDGDIDFYVSADNKYNLLFEGLYNTNELRDEVEIIEEDKEIEYIHYHEANNQMECEGALYKTRVIDKALVKKINELIYEINKLKGEIENERK